MTPLKKAEMAHRALRLLPEQQKLFRQIVAETTRLTKQQNRLRDDVGELKRQAARWKKERDLMIMEAGEVAVPGIVGIAQRTVCEHYQIPRRELLSHRRHKSVVMPRQIAMWLAKQCSMRSLPEIGRLFRNRDHTTILHAVRKIDSLRTKDRDFVMLTNRLKERVDAEVEAVRARAIAAASGESQSCQPAQIANGQTKMS